MNSFNKDDHQTHILLKMLMLEILLKIVGIFYVLFNFHIMQMEWNTLEKIIFKDNFDDLPVPKTGLYRNNK